jgi:uncharacterized protein YndB with AHSA1/START domain
MINEKSMTKRDKVIFEYPLNATSIQMIWEAISTSNGLSSWFADSVTSYEKKYSFSWGKHEAREAELINSRQNTYVRFHWLDEEPGTYFEIRIIRNELTGDYTLSITDFALSEEEEDIRSLWDTSIDAIHRCGL